MPAPKLPANLTIDKIMAAAEESMFGNGNIGFCIDCGAETDGVEPDARKCSCPSCDAMAVYGAEELLIMFAC